MSPDPSWCPRCSLVCPPTLGPINCFLKSVLPYISCVLHHACLSYHGEVCYWRTGSQPAHSSAVTAPPVMHGLSQAHVTNQERKKIKHTLAISEIPYVVGTLKHTASRVHENPVWMGSVNLLIRLRKLLVLRKTEWSLQGCTSNRWESQELRRVHWFESPMQLWLPWIVNPKDLSFWYFRKQHEIETIQEEFGKILVCGDPSGKQATALFQSLVFLGDFLPAFSATHKGPCLHNSPTFLLRVLRFFHHD